MVCLASAYEGSRLPKCRPRFQRGVTSIEYALLGALIFLVILVSVAAVGDATASTWSEIGDKVAAVIQRALGG